MNMNVPVHIRQFMYQLSCKLINNNTYSKGKYSERVFIVAQKELA